MNELEYASPKRPSGLSPKVIFRIARAIAGASIFVVIVTFSDSIGATNPVMYAIGLPLRLVFLSSVPEVANLIIALCYLAFLGALLGLAVPYLVRLFLGPIGITFSVLCAIASISDTIRLHHRYDVEMRFNSPSSFGDLVAALHFWDIYSVTFTCFAAIMVALYCARRMIRKSSLLGRGG